LSSTHTFFLALFFMTAALTFAFVPLVTLHTRFLLLAWTLAALHTTRRFLESLLVTEFGDAKMHACSMLLVLECSY
jgi:hypothetical protein